MTFRSKVIVPIAVVMVAVGVGLFWSRSGMVQEAESKPTSRPATAPKPTLPPKPAEGGNLVTVALPAAPAEAKPGVVVKKPAAAAQELAQIALDAGKSAAERLQAWEKLRNEHRFSAVPGLASMLARMSISNATEVDRKILVGMRAWLRDSDDYEAAGRTLAEAFWNETGAGQANLLELQHPGFLRQLYLEAGSGGREAWRQQIEAAFTQSPDVRAVRELALLAHKGHLPQDRALGLLDRWIAAHWDGAVQEQLASWYLAADQSSTEQFFVESMLTMRAPEVLARVELKKSNYQASTVPSKE
jgi:hypothetical protein